MFEKEKILVVGGSSGIGLAVAKHAQQEGAQVVIASRNAPMRISRLTDIPKDMFEAHSFDITSADDCTRLFELTGEIDHLVITVRPDINTSPFQEIDIHEMKRSFNSKFWGSCQLIQVAQRRFRNPGSITLTSGIAGEKIFKGASTMAIINSATETLCRTLAIELAPLRVNAVSPGFVKPKPTEVQEYASQFPARRLASVSDVAMAYIYLMANPYATGTVTVVDGGARLI